MLSVWCYLVLDGTMTHPVLSGRDSWMSFKTRSYRTLPRTSCDEPVFRELTLECGDNGVPAFTLDDEDNTDRFHLVYSGDHEVCLHDSPLNLSVNLIRNCGTPAPIGSYLVQILPSSGIVSQHE